MATTIEMLILRKLVSMKRTILMPVAWCTFREKRISILWFDFLEG